MDPDTGMVLLGQVLDALDDEAARLIYADWLEEQGDELADLIRAHCAQREPEPALIARLVPRLAPVADWMIDGHVFVDGMIDRIRLSAGKYAQKGTQATLTRLLSRFGLATTVLQNHSGKVHKCSTLAWTTGLLWSDCHLTDYEVQELAESPYITRLRTLSFDKPRCANDALHALAESPYASRVRHFGLRSPPDGGLYDAEGVLEVVDALPLASLDLGGDANKIDCAALDAPPLAKLDTLALTASRWMPIARSRHLKNLTSLRVVSFGSRNDEAVLALLENPTFAKLEQIELVMRELREAVLEQLHARFGERCHYDSFGW